MAYNLKKFQTEAEYSAATLNYPAVSWVVSGDTIHFDKTEPTPQVKWLATYAGGTTSSAECDASSAITRGEITLTDLESLEIGNCVTSIGGHVFYGCYSLVSATIGDNVTSIGEYALYGCGLASITCLATVPPTLGSYAIADTAIAYGEGYIYVPAESVNLYKEAEGWSEYSSRIQAIQ